VKIAIVGGGIGGMTLALSLHDAGPRSQSAEPLTTFAFRGRTEDPDRTERFAGVFAAHVRRWRAGPYPWSLLACAGGCAGNRALWGGQGRRPTVTRRPQARLPPAKKGAGSVHPCIIA